MPGVVKELEVEQRQRLQAARAWGDLSGRYFTHQAPFLQVKRKPPTYRPFPECSHLWDVWLCWSQTCSRRRNLLTLPPSPYCLGRRGSKPQVKMAGALLLSVWQLLIIPGIYGLPGCTQMDT